MEDVRLGPSVGEVDIFEFDGRSFGGGTGGLGLPVDFGFEFHDFVKAAGGDVGAREDDEQHGED